MRSLPFSNIVAALVFFGVLTVMGLTEVKPRRISAASGAPQYDRSSKQVLLATAQIGTVLAFVCGAFVTGAAMGGPRWVVFGAGVVVMIVGIAFRRWAIATLGDYFTHDVRVADDQPVVDAGPYRFVRHPSYAGALLSLAGMGLALGNWLALAAAVAVPMIGYVRRIVVEEQALGARLGDRYREYARGRARLLPHVW